MTPRDEVDALKRWFPDAEELCEEPPKPKLSMPLTLREFLERERAEGREVMVPGEVYLDDITRKSQMVELLSVAALAGWALAGVLVCALAGGGR